MIPHLLRLVAQPSAPDARPSALNELFGSDSMHGAALTRLYELAPDLARPLLLQEIRQPRIDSDFATLSMLPDATLPELDATLAANLARNISTPLAKLHSLLVERYATGAVSAKVRSVYDRLGATADVKVRALLLAYFWRTDVATATALTSAAIAAPSLPATPAGTNLSSSILYAVASVRMTAELERMAIAQINHPNANVALQAIQTVGRFGSAAAREPLWQRLQQFHDQWKDRADELNAYKPETEAPRRIELSLVYALREGPAWNSFKAGLERMHDLAVTNGTRQRIESDLTQSTIIHLDYEGDGTTSKLSWTLLWYSGDTLESLKAKLGQFAPGTIFTDPYWQINTPTPDADRKRLTTEIRSFLEERGMQLR
jgi:hypothetical protein